MGCYLDVPVMEKDREIGEGNQLSYGISAMQGWRDAMEDTHATSLGLRDHEDWSYFAIFDGHAGSTVAKYCAQNLLDTIVRTEKFKIGDVVASIHGGFLQLDEDMHSRMSGQPVGGSTAICVFITPQQIYYANCGDSRATMCRCGDACFATRDHKPFLEEESARIYKAGGSVLVQRVNGSLAVSRALGDYEYKMDCERGVCEQMVTPEPDVYVRKRHETDEFLVLACDGIWDVMSTEDVCRFIYSRLLLTNDILAVCDMVIDTCFNKGSRDNMSIAIILFPAAPKVAEFALKRERRLERQIVKVIKAEIIDSDIKEYSELLKVLHASDDIDELPPGGGLFAKYDLIQKTFQEIFPNKVIDCQEASFGCQQP